MELTIKLSPELQRSLDRLIDAIGSRVIQMTTWPDVETAANGVSGDAATVVVTTQNRETAPSGTEISAADTLSEEPMPAVPAETYPTLADLRAAVGRVRVRLIGEDWEAQHSEQTPLDARYYKPILRYAKDVARHFGVDKIQQVPDANRAEAIKLIDALRLDANGDIVPLAPY